MGMPISSYTILRTIAQGGQTFQLDAVKKALSPYNLYAFILHDPETHIEFHEHLAHHFDQYDYITGPKLLFFALVDPPQEWLNHAHDRRYYRDLATWEATELANPQNAPTSADKSLTAYAVAHSLGIESDKLPCVVVTNSFRSRRVFWFRTCPEHLEEQFAELGYLAQRKIAKLNIDQPIDELMRRLAPKSFDLCMGSGGLELFESTAKALSDLLSFVAAGSPKRDGLDYDAVEQAQQAVRQLYDQLRYMKARQGDPDFDAMGHVSRRILEAFALLNKRTSDNLYGFVPVPKEYLEQDSYQILRTAHRVYDLLVTEQDESVEAILEQTDDFSPGVIGLAKVFEREVNLSVVHWMRGCLGIELPRYFEQCQPGVQARQGRADLNACNNGRWIPPELGKSKRAFEELSVNSLPTGWTKSLCDELIQQWNILHRHRNDAAHDRVVGEDAVLEVRDTLANLARSDFFRRFFDMKTLYRGTRQANLAA